MNALRIKAWLRLAAIYQELGYNPWRRPHTRKPTTKNKGVYVGALESIPFLNDDAKRTFAHLLLRPGQMMRDYILRRQHERYLAPFTALLVFYSLFSLLLAVTNPGSLTPKSSSDVLKGLDDIEWKSENDSTVTDHRAQLFLKEIVGLARSTALITRLDRYPDAVDTPWKASLAAIESDLRNKGIPLFLDNFLFMWMALAVVLRKYRVSFSGAAAMSGYILCQFCLFMFLALIFSWGAKTDIGILIMGALLIIDYIQMLAIPLKKAFWLTVRTGVQYLIFRVLFYILMGAVILGLALLRT